MSTALVLSPMVPRARLEEAERRIEAARRDREYVRQYTERHFETIVFGWVEVARVAPVESQRAMARRALDMVADDVVTTLERDPDAGWRNRRQLNDLSEQALAEMLDAIVSSHPEPLALMEAMVGLWTQERY